MLRDLQQTVGAETPLQPVAEKVGICFRAYCDKVVIYGMDAGWLSPLLRLNLS